MNGLAFKAAVPMALVGAATLAGRRWGNIAAGLMGGLPVVAGPILFFYAREQGTAYAVEASRMTLLSIVSLSLFLLTFAWRARFGATLLNCLLLGWAVFAAATVVMDRIAELHPLDLFRGLAYALAALYLARRSLPPPLDPSGAARMGPPSPWDLPLRLAAAAALVLALTGLAERLGPRLGGLLTAFPVASTVLSAFAYRQGGRDAVLAVIKGLLVSLNAYAVFCAALSLALPLGLLVGFAAALACAVAVQALLLRAVLGPWAAASRPS